MLTKEQKITIKDLECHLGITNPTDIVKWCVNKIKTPYRKRKTKAFGGGHRRIGRWYYQGILEHYIKQVDQS